MNQKLAQAYRGAIRPNKADYRDDVDRVLALLGSAPDTRANRKRAGARARRELGFKLGSGADLASYDGTLRAVDALAEGVSPRREFARRAARLSHRARGKLRRALLALAAARPGNVEVRP